MVKALGALLLVGGTTTAGIGAMAKFKTRARVLAAFRSSLDIMRSEICELLSPLGDVMQKLSESAEAPLDTFFAECAKRQKEFSELPFGMVWTKALRDATYLELRGSDREILCELGAMLGRYSAKEQERAILYASRALDGAMMRAEDEYRSFGKMCGKLGILCGIGIMIVFI